MREARLLIQTLFRGYQVLLWSPLLESRRLLLPPCPHPTRPVCHKREQGHVGSLGFLSRYLFSLSSGGQKFKITVSAGPRPSLEGRALRFLQRLVAQGLL